MAASFSGQYFPQVVSKQLIENDTGNIERIDVAMIQKSPPAIRHGLSSTMPGMSPWAESLGVLVLAAGGGAVGAWFSRLPKPWWLLGYLLPLALVVVCGICNHYPDVSRLPVIPWFMLGRVGFA